MTHFAGLLPPSVLRPVGWALVHFLWEGAALAALLAVAMTMTRRATTRYALAVATLALMAAAPVATYFVERGASRNAPNAAATTTQPAGASVQTYIATLPAHIAKTAAQNMRPDVLFWLVQIWMAGVLLLSLRNLGGLLLIERMRRKESVPVSDALLEKCLALQRRLRLDRVIRYCESHRLDAPAVIGWFRPVVLLPATALTGLSEEQLSAVIAHELAHIQRLDSFVNLFQVAVETILFYHPAVWWVSRRIRVERENCCDDAAIQVSGDPLQYARALTVMAESRVAPSLAMAINRSPLEARVMRLLGLETLGNGLRTAGLAAGVLCLAGAVFAGNAIVGSAQVSLGPGGAVTLLHEAQQTAVVKVLSKAVARATTSVRTQVHANVSEHVATRAEASERTSENARGATEVHAAAEANAAAAQEQSAASQDAATAKQEAKSSYIESLRAQGLTDLSIDELVELKIQGVTGDYVKSLHDLGLKPSVDEIVSMKVQGVTSDYIKGLASLGWKPDIDEIVAMKVQGVTADYAKQFSDLGLKPSLDELIALKVQGVTPQYVSEMRAAGINASDMDEIIGLKVQGITPEYVKSVHDLGWKADADTVIGLKVQGVTQDYVREMKAAGMDGDADAFIGMKVQGVTPEYLKQMHDLGLKFDSDDVVGMKVQGVTPDYIRAIRATGLNPDKDDIVGMKVQGVTAEYIKALQAAGFKDINVDNVIGAKVQGITPEFIADAQKHGFKDLTLEKLIELKRADIF
jgi:beta-lactamase regulating signal transducer with metallopeptidase domain